MNYTGLIMIPVIFSMFILVAVINLRILNGREASIRATMKKNNNRVVRIKGISSVSNECPFSAIHFNGSSACYKVIYVNEANESKVIFVRFTGLSKEGTWKEARQN